MEIGSEFWLDPTPKKQDEKNQFLELMNKYGNITLTSSGRSAYSLLLENIKVKVKRVLLPIYTCDSVIKAFKINDYECIYYDVDAQLRPNLVTIPNSVEFSIFVHMGYFGFRTNDDLGECLKKFKKQSVIIIEDVTHTLFSNSKYVETDYYVGSIRKWLGIPSGGFLATNIKAFECSEITHDSFVSLRKIGLENKAKFILNNQLQFKELYLKQFNEAEIILDGDYSPYIIDEFSKEILSSYDFNTMKLRRLENYRTLLEGLSDLTWMKPIFTSINNKDCPMFFPIVINEGRSEIRNKLIEAKVYCPIHWPIPEDVINLRGNYNLNLYNQLLSIPCDQRYKVNDMRRIVEILKSL